ncbi:hypothetical protein AB0D14_35400 [Streptomyces sp. NPDC048484]|uniref:hypothetical protein n=1 Tax=Streptomyces sp. NPDC048484 TaxID=3155146 RepID=UPI0034332366
MPDPVYPLPSGDGPPSLGTYNAMGTTLLHNSRPDASGCFFATCWIVFILPVVPLGRYYVRQGKITDESGFSSVRTTTEYEFVGSSRLRSVEVIRTYLYFWIAVPAAFLGPIIASIAWDNNTSNDNAQFYGMLVSVASLCLLLLLLFLHRTRWRPVRRARWIEPETAKVEGRRRQIASLVPIAFLAAFFAFWAGLAIFTIALAMGMYPNNLAPDPNPLADTLLHPVTLFVGLPATAGVIAPTAVAIRRR